MLILRVRERCTKAFRMVDVVQIFTAKATSTFLTQKVPPAIFQIPSSKYDTDNWDFFISIS